jgi:hypothetical protein
MDDLFLPGLLGFNEVTIRKAATQAIQDDAVCPSE